MPAFFCLMMGKSLQIMKVSVKGKDMNWRTPDTYSRTAPEQQNEGLVKYF